MGWKDRDKLMNVKVMTKEKNRIEEIGIDKL